MKAPRITRRSFMIGSAGVATAALAWRANAAGNPVGRAAQASAGAPLSKLAVADPSRIRALQFTDIHFFCERDGVNLDGTTIENLSKLVELSKPDLLLVSGDLWHDNPNGRGREYMEFAVEQIAALGKPWVFVWGNHDQLDDYMSGHEYLANAKHSLYAGGSTGGNYRVEMTDKEGAARFEFVCVNTASDGCDDHTRAYLDGLTTERGDAKRLPAMGVMHIPVQQYVDLWEKGQPTGIRLETVCNQEERGETLPVWKRACDLRACIVGHDHVNNYHGLVDGVDLIYGQATGSGGYGGGAVPKGARLYHINADTGNIASEIYFPDGSVWIPEPNWHTEDILDVPWDTEEKLNARKAAAEKAANSA